MRVIHGGTDAGPRVRIDLSTNANPYGPSPFARQAMATSISAYPDPSYTDTRRALGTHYGIDPAQIVVGAGATELIYRLAMLVPGPLGAPMPGFGEYAGAGAIFNRPWWPLPQHPDTAGYHLPSDGLVFITNPGSPDGLVRSMAWVHDVHTQAQDQRTLVVWDMAYSQLVDPAIADGDLAVQIAAYPEDAILLFAPNKSHGCTGLRAGWLRAPEPIATRLRAIQMSWILSAPGAAFLTHQACAGADAWVRVHALRLHATATQLCTALTQLGWPTTKGHTPWLMTQPPDVALAARLRADLGVKVRDLESQGCPGWWRIGTPHHRDLHATITAFRTIADR